ncbi:unnamed protein product [Gadus morhua 'NCC']
MPATTAKCVSHYDRAEHAGVPLYGVNPGRSGGAPGAPAVPVTFFASAATYFKYVEPVPTSDECPAAREMFASVLHASRASCTPEGARSTWSLALPRAPVGALKWRPAQARCAGRLRPPGRASGSRLRGPSDLSSLIS